MLAFLSWYVLVSLLGWVSFPIAYRLFPALADRGYALGRALGLLLWGYLFWLLASFGAAQNDLGGLTLAMLIVMGLSLWALRSTADSLRTAWAGLRAWLRANLRMIATVEILFLLSFAFLAFVRSADPSIAGTEKPMELAFINAIIRSPKFPPLDPWLSGYAISYYHFGYVMAAMLAKFTAVAGSVAFNLMISLVFALSAVGAYGIIYDLLAKVRWRSGNERASDGRKGTQLVGLPLLGPAFLLIVSNLEGLLEVLHRRGVGWDFSLPLARSSFWEWLGIKDLVLPPAQPLGWIPERHWWWWRASRVVQDYDLAGNFREVIDEFPFFSYLLGDLHPHVLAMPFGLLAVALALNICLGGWRGETNLYLTRLHIHPIGFFSTALVLGGMAFLNTWDILIAFALVAGAYLLSRVRDEGWRWRRIAEALAFCIPVGVLALILYLPFYVGFSSQLGGVLPNLVNPTRGAHLWVMFGTLLLPVMAFLVYVRFGERRRTGWLVGFLGAVLLAVFLWGVSWLLAWLMSLAAQDLPGFAAAQGAPDLASLFVQAAQRRGLYIGGLMTVLLVLGGGAAFLVRTRSQRRVEKPAGDGDAHSASMAFVLLLIVLAALLVLAPEFVYLRDQFGSRMNTIFKFYYQAWMLWSLAAAFGTALLLRSLRGFWDLLHRFLLVLLLLAALVYPALGLLQRTNNFQIPAALAMYRACNSLETDSTDAQGRDCLAESFSVWTLDGAAYIKRDHPEDAEAIAFLMTKPSGVVAEAVGGSYSYYARISTHTGLPTVLGWPGHESQWRGGYTVQGTRIEDVRLLYESRDWVIAKTIVERYAIRYIVLGSLERSTYNVSETKFQLYLPEVFHSGGLVIYEVP